MTLVASEYALHLFTGISFFWWLCPYPVWFGAALNLHRKAGAQEENILLHVLTDSYELHQLILHHHHLLFSQPR